MENEFGEKLNQREIQPSPAAWDRLDAMLTATEAQKPRRSFNRLFIAASFLGFLLIGTLFFRQGTATEPENNAIATETAVKPEAETFQVIDAAATGTETRVASLPQPKSAPAGENKPPAVRKTDKAIAAPEEQQIANNTIVNQNQSQLPGINHQSPINQKTQLNQPAENATGPNADELLAAAQSKREKRPTAVRVNSQSLLSQVDNQAEAKLSLKQKALRALNKNYQQVKVAVATRNLEENH